MRNSAFYFGTVSHRRMRPRRHYLHYRMFWVLLDLDELEDIGRNLPGFSHNRFNLLSFYSRDHGDGSATPLRLQITRQLATAGIDLAKGTIRLLAMPRVFGYGFNPLSIFFCCYPDGSLAALLYEVHNTFGERHSYLFPGKMVRQQSHSCAKYFHVSPFLGMDMRYTFRTQMGGGNLSVAIVASDHEGKLIAAAMSGKQRPLDLRHLLRALVLFPLLTFKVTAAIHWNALQLWLKRIEVRRKPSEPAALVTLVRSETAK